MSQPARALRAVPADSVVTGPATGWEPPVPLTAARTLPAFPVDALPGWVGDQIIAPTHTTEEPKIHGINHADVCVTARVLTAGNHAGKTMEIIVA